MLRNRNNLKPEGISSPKISRPSSPAAISSTFPCERSSEPQTPSEQLSVPKSPFKSAEEKISECLYSGEIVDIEKLKKLAWNGIPDPFRALCWKVLMVQYIYF